MQFTSSTHGNVVQLVKQQKLKISVYSSLGFIEANRVFMLKKLSQYNPTSRIFISLDTDKSTIYIK